MGGVATKGYEMSEVFNTQGKTSMSDFDMGRFEHFIRNRIINDLHEAAVDAMRSNEYNFNDTAVRAKTFFLAIEIVRNSTP